MGKSGNSCAALRYCYEGVTIENVTVKGTVSSHKSLPLGGMASLKMTGLLS